MDGLDEDWLGICNEITRISSGELLELDLQISGKLEHGYGEDELYVRIMEKTTSLSDHPKNCTHFWNHGLGPFPCGQVRSKCKP